MVASRIETENGPVAARPFRSGNLATTTTARLRAVYLHSAIRPAPTPPPLGASVCVYTSGPLRFCPTAMTQGGLSRVVARLLRPFQRKERRERPDAGGSKYDANLAANSKLVLSSAACNDVELPSAFFRLLRAVLQQTPATVEAINSGVAPLRYSNFSASTGSLLKRADPVTSKTLERMLALLGDDEGRHSDDSAALGNSRISFADGRPTLYGKRSTRSVPLRAAAEQLLQLWECMAQILSAGREATTRSTMSQPHGGHQHAVSLEEQSQLEYSALSLMLLLAQRQEFDSLFLVLAHGGCKAHQQTAQPRRRSSVGAGSFRGERANSVVVALPPSRQSVAVHPSRKSSRRSAKKDKQAEAERPLCDIARKYLELHQQTLLFAYAATHGSTSPTAAHAKILLAKPKSCEVARTLFSTMVALSYARVQYMREQILESLQNTLQRSVASGGDRKARFSSSNPQQERVRSKSRYEEMSTTMFQWNQYISVKCDQCIGPFSNSDGWMQPAHLVNQILSDNEGRMLLIAHLIQHLSPQLAMGQIEWRTVPGFQVILQVILASTRTIYEAQLVEMEPKWQESDAEERATTGKEEHSIRDSFSIASESGRGSDSSSSSKSCASFFFAQVMAMLHDNPQFIRDFLLNVLERTNYSLPHHVELCLQYLGKLVTEFPSYFVNESQAHRAIGSTGGPSACADTELLNYVFTCLMESEHFSILKHTELFLLKHFAHLSISLQGQLTALFAAQFRRLFFHWNRDVRYCYYHILLYLTYPGNRLVLCAKSDESIMGAEAAQLFEIPGLVRTSSGANWDVFDTPLYQALARYNHVTRARRRGVASKPLPPTWADEVPFTVIERTIKEYKTHVQTYFAYARQLSLHERVPTPAFEVKSASSTASSSKGKSTPAPLPAMKLSR